MPSKLCFWIGGREICIPIYVEIRKWYPFPDPGPYINIDDILTFPEIRQGRAAGETISWLTEIGLDARQQQTLGSMVRVWDAAQGLSANARDQIGEILNAGAKDFGLGEGANLSFSTDMAR